MGVTVLQGGEGERRARDWRGWLWHWVFSKATAAAEAMGESLTGTGRAGVMGRQPPVAPNSAIGLPCGVNLSIPRMSPRK